MEVNQTVVSSFIDPLYLSRWDLWIVTKASQNYSISRINTSSLEILDSLSFSCASEVINSIAVRTLDQATGQFQVVIGGHVLPSSRALILGYTPLADIPRSETPVPFVAEISFPSASPVAHGWARVHSIYGQVNSLAIASNGDVIACGNSIEISNSSQYESFLFASNSSSGDLLWNSFVPGETSPSSCQSISQYQEKLFIQGHFWAPETQSLQTYVFAFEESPGHIPFPVPTPNQAKNPLWVVQQGSPEHEYGSVVRIAGEKIFLSTYSEVHAEVLCLDKSNPSSAPLWTVKLESSSLTKVEDMIPFEINGKTHLFLVGRIAGTDGTGFDASKNKDGGFSNAFLAEIDDSGNLKWIDRMTAKTIDVAYALAIQRVSKDLLDLFLCGSSGDVKQDFGFLQKFQLNTNSNTRKLIFHQTLPGNRGFCKDVSFDFDGNVWITGAIPDNSTNLNAQDLFLTKLSPEGIWLVHKVLADFYSQEGEAVVICEDNSVLVAGNVFTEDNQAEVLLARFSSSGDLLWKSVWNPSSLWVNFKEMILHDLGIFIVGYTRTSMFQAIITKFNLNGDVVWFSSRAGIDSPSQAISIHHSSTAIVVAGSAYGNLTKTSGSAGKWDWVLFEIDSDSPTYFESESQVSTANPIPESPPGGKVAGIIVAVISIGIILGGLLYVWRSCASPVSGEIGKNIELPVFHRRPPGAIRLSQRDQDSQSEQEDLHFTVGDETDVDERNTR